MEFLIFKVQHFCVTFARFFINFINGFERCAVCGSATFITPICRKCKKNEFSVEKSLAVPRCNCCGRFLISTENECFACRENKLLKSTDRVIPLFSYRLWNKDLMFRWKIEGIRALSAFFALEISKLLKAQNIDIVVPVPPRKGKIRKNGWDQIDELCKYLKFFHKIRILNLLERKSTIQQKKLHRDERLKTITSAYKLLDENKIKKNLESFDSFLPERLCLLDDVCTTGATIECCASLLKKAGVKEVVAITLFTVD